MSWFEETFPATTREIQRIIAKVRPVLRGDWLGLAGKRVRNTLQSISDFAKDHNATATELLEDAIELGRHKLEGVAEQERAAAIQKFAEAEKLNIEATLQRRVMESKVRKEEAEARLKELEVIKAEAELLKQLHDLGVVIHRDDDGKLTVIPAPPGLDLRELARSDADELPSAFPSAERPTGAGRAKSQNESPPLSPRTRSYKS